MALRSRGRKLSFDILTTSISFEDDNNSFFYRSNSDHPVPKNGDRSESPKPLRKRKNKVSKKKNKGLIDSSISEGSTELELDSKSYSSLTQTVVYEEERVPEENGVLGTVSSVTGLEFFNLNGGELRQRSAVNGGGEEASENVKVGSSSGNSKELNSSTAKQRSEVNGSVAMKLETEESLDWNRVMAEDPTYFLEKFPLKYFMEEMDSGNSLRTTSTLANEKERERVYVI